MSDLSVVMPFSLLVLRWLVAFLFTQAVEVPIYRKTLRCGYDVAFGASAITHPIAWFLIAGIGHGPPGLSWPQAAMLAELFAWLVETAYFAVLLRRPRVATLMTWTNAARWTALANASSFTLGCFAYQLVCFL